MKLRNKKTGKIGELSGVNRIVVYEPNMPLCGNSILGEYDTLAELNEEWEDYKPAEPLIKDEKIRKAVRAWAEANIIKNVMFEYVEGEGSYFSNCSCAIRFYEDLQLTNRHEYTLPELCGSEEE